jgi:NDP-sugar pyrophosphorylase family protein
MMMGGDRAMQALILAGGEGRRMSRVTAHLPKPLLYLPGGTLLEHQLALLVRLPVSHTFVVTHHRTKQLKQALRRYEDVTLLPQRPPFTLLGALATAEGYVTEPLIILHADNYFSQGMAYLLQEAQTGAVGSKSDAVFLVDPQANRAERALRLASTGCYILSPEVFPVVKRVHGCDKLLHLTGALLEGGAIVKEVLLRGWRANINRLQDLLRVTSRILEDWPGCFHPQGAAEGYNRDEGCLEVGLPLWISSESEVVDSHLGPDVVVGRHARVHNCVLREVTVFPGAHIVEQRLEGGIVLPARTGFVFLTP